MMILSNNLRAVLVMFVILAAPLGAEPDGESGDKARSITGQGANSESEQLDAIGRSWIRELRGENKPADEQPAERSQQLSTETEGRIILNNPSPGETKKSQSLPSAETEPGRPTAQVNRPARPLFEKSDEELTLSSIVFRFVLMLGLMLGIFYVAMRFLKGRSGSFNSAGELVEVLAMAPLMPGKFIQIVDLAGKLMVLGVSDGGINILSEIEDARTVDRIRLWQSQKNSNPIEHPASFLDWLSGLLKNSEYRFWGRGVDDFPGKRKKELANFRELLATQGVNLSDSGTATSSLEDLDEKELARLLSRQKQRLAALKKDA